MHANTVLRRLLAPVFSSLDQRNVHNLLQAVCACLDGRRLGLMALARHWPGALQVTAPLKRLDRLLSNPRLQTHRERFYQLAIAWLVRQRNPTLIVDWSELTRDGRWQLLRAAVALKGRSLTVYEEVHPQRHLNSPRVHKQFLRRLHTILPADCRPLILTDAGFHTPWFRAVADQGWFWLGRVRGRIQVRLDTETSADTGWHPVRAYYPRATRKAECLGPGLLTASNPITCRVIRIKRPPQGRQSTRRRDGRRARGGKARKMARRQREPWVLVCSPELSVYSARALVRLYRRRMQIEATFRDLKSHHYGCAFEDTQTRDQQRLAMLLLIHMLATLVAWLAGLASRARHERRFKLSLLRQGWEQLRVTHQRLIGGHHPSWQQLRELVVAYDELD